MKEDTCGIGLVTEDRSETDYVLHETNPAAICLESGQIQRPLALWLLTKAQRDSSHLMTVSAACHSAAFRHIVPSAAGDVLPVLTEERSVTWPIIHGRGLKIYIPAYDG